LDRQHLAGIYMDLTGYAEAQDISTGFTGFRGYLHSSRKERVSRVTRLQSAAADSNGTLLPFSLHFNPENPVILSENY
jgi:hypothetical protein